MNSSLSDESLTDLTDRLRRQTKNSRDITRAKPAVANQYTRSTAARICSNLTRQNDSARSRNVRWISLLPTFSRLPEPSILPGSNELPESFDEATELVSLLKKRTGAGAQREEGRVARVHDLSHESSRNFSASRLKTFASTLKTVTEIGPMTRKTVTLFPRRQKLPREVRTARCRRSSAFASSRSTKSCARAASARSIFLFPRLVELNNGRLA